MLYNNLVNFSLTRQFLLHSRVKIENVFSFEELNAIQKYVDKKEKQQSEVKTAENKINLDARSSKIFFMHFSETAKDLPWMFEKINFFLQRANEDYFNYDLNGYDYIQYSEYSSEEKGHYNFHIDTVMDDVPKNEYDFLCRKLSFSLCLNQQGVDYSGGDFELKTHFEPTKIKINRGDMLIFPSFLLHRVCPVTEGVRKSLVGWVTGPKFR